MGLRLKGQLLTLFLGLYGLAFVGLTYFNLTVMIEQHRVRTEQEAEHQAVRVFSHMVGHLPAQLTPKSVLDLAARSSQSLIEPGERFSDVRYLELYSAVGEKLFGYGRRISRFPLHQEARAAMERGESYRRLWGFAGEEDSEGRPLEVLAPFTTDNVALEYYAPILNSEHKLCGFIHISLDVPRARLGLNVLVLGNLIVGAVFLVSSLLAINLWGEYALNRPLRGLVEAERRLKSLETEPLDEPFLSSNELVAVSRSFNHMALALVKYQRELEQKTVRLEQANERYRALNEDLEHKVEEKTLEMKEFFSLVTHDLRIPLAAVAGYAELLSRPRSGELNERGHKFVRNILAANSHAQELVRNLLDAMRYEFGHPQLVEQEFDLKELIEEVTSQLAPHEEGPGIELHLPPTPTPVYADRTKISRVLSNLLGNALRHTESGRTRVSLTVAEAGPDWQVSISDDGPGIPQEHLPMLFEKFTQFPSERGPSSGLGLGLYIVGRILQDHGRTIDVVSPEGQGTTFSFRLGRARGPAEEQE